jgi:Tfp pilus assembly protein PilE
MIVVALMAVLLMFAIPSYQDGIRKTHETGAMQAIHTLNTDQVQYFSQNGRFARSLTEFGPRTISGELAAGERGGYRFRMEETREGYAIHAEPVKFGTTGSRTFFSDETMIIRQNKSAAPATADSEEAK